ncbi:Ricin-type beta-trefoil lectin domain-like [Lentzea waywayandensis]|uniref:Ricin-type beta-trefoil lectin domain-like n=1 Tax=Lentzea waywayandensis TaxID=84724 RepID=A0A1I6FEK7_9PSEU|nr:RICIN domain-containing protein [Lentzea waywayandensis]SFR28416.1 Ricin-type beta-trefoil lectin domain-like [Lentzea waywayandensis]
MNHYMGRVSGYTPRAEGGVFRKRLMRKTKLSLSAVLAAITAVLGSPLLGSAPMASASAHGPYLFRNVQTGKCIDIPDGTGGNGVKAQQWECWGGDMQRWWLDDAAYTGTAYYRIRNVQNGKCLDIPGGDPAWGVQVQQWDCWGSGNEGLMQQWQVFQLGNNQFYLKNRATGLCIDVPGGNTTSGAVLQQWNCWGGTMQRWF